MIATFPSRQVAKMLNLTDVQRRLVPASWTKWSKGLVFGDRYIYIYTYPSQVSEGRSQKDRSVLLTFDSWSESKNYEHFSVPVRSFFFLFLSLRFEKLTKDPHWGVKKANWRIDQMSLCRSVLWSSDSLCFLWKLCHFSQGNLSIYSLPCIASISIKSISINSSESAWNWHIELCQFLFSTSYCKICGGRCIHIGFARLCFRLDSPHARFQKVWTQWFHPPTLSSAVLLCKAVAENLVTSLGWNWMWLRYSSCDMVLECMMDGVVFSIPSALWNQSHQTERVTVTCWWHLVGPIT